MEKTCLYSNEWEGVGLRKWEGMVKENNNHNNDYGYSNDLDSDNEEE